MSRRLLVLSTLALASMVALGATAAFACEHGASACRVSKAPATRTALVPLPSVALPAVSAAIPMLPSSPVQPAVVSSLRAFLDPESGLITSPINLLQAPVDLQMPDQDLSNLPQVQLRDGSWMMDTSSLLFDYIVNIDALGHRAYTHSRDRMPAIAPIVTPTVAPYAER